MSSTAARSNPRLVEFLDGLASELPGVERRKMFGAPALFAGGRMFACVYGNRLGLKVPADVADGLRREKGIEDFRPEGRAPMREWIALTPARIARGDDAGEIVRTAFRFVAQKGARTRTSKRTTKETAS